MNHRRDLPRRVAVAGVLARAAPVVAAVAVAYVLARVAPYWVLGVNRWLWWFGLFAVANTCLVLGDNIRARLMRQESEPSP